MDADEWEVLELFGAYFFDFSLVPIAWHESQSKPIKLIRDEDMLVIDSWWQHHEPTISAVNYFDEHLIRADSSPYEHALNDTVWTDVHHHRVELWESDADGIARLDIKIDARYSYADFLARVVKFAIRAGCLFYLCYDEMFVQPSSTAVFEALNRSPAAALASKQKPTSKIN